MGAVGPVWLYLLRRRVGTREDSVKFPMLVSCNCGEQTTVETIGDERFPDVQCNACQKSIWVIDDGLVSTRVFCRADVELSGGDWSLAIILSAMSVECELA